MAADVLAERLSHRLSHQFDDVPAVDQAVHHGVSVICLSDVLEGAQLRGP